MECLNCNTDLTDLLEKYSDWKYLGDMVICPECGKQYEVCGDEYDSGQSFYFEEIN